MQGIDIRVCSTSSSSTKPTTAAGASPINLVPFLIVAAFDLCRAVVGWLQEERRKLCHIHLDPILVHCDYSLHGWRVREGEKKGLAVDLMDKVDIVPRAIEHFPDKGPFHAGPCKVLCVGKGGQ